MTAEDLSGYVIESGDEADEDNAYLHEIKEKEKWDCESILSTYSNIYNHPQLIKDSVSKRFLFFHSFHVSAKN